MKQNSSIAKLLIKLLRSYSNQNILKIYSNTKLFIDNDDFQQLPMYEHRHSQ